MLLFSAMLDIEDTLTKDKQALCKLYEMGYADGKKITDFLQKGEVPNESSAD